MGFPISAVFLSLLIFCLYFQVEKTIRTGGKWFLELHVVSLQVSMTLYATKEFIVGTKHIWWIFQHQLVFLSFFIFCLYSPSQKSSRYGCKMILNTARCKFISFLNSLCNWRVSRWHKARVWVFQHLEHCFSFSSTLTSPSKKNKTHRCKTERSDERQASLSLEDH